MTTSGTWRNKFIINVRAESAFGKLWVSITAKGDGGKEAHDFTRTMVNSGKAFQIDMFLYLKWCSLVTVLNISISDIIKDQSKTTKISFHGIPIHISYIHSSVTKKKDLSKLSLLVQSYLFYWLLWVTGISSTRDGILHLCYIATCVCQNTVCEWTIAIVSEGQSSPVELQQVR